MPNPYSLITLAYLSAHENHPHQVYNRKKNNNNNNKILKKIVKFTQIYLKLIHINLCIIV